MSIKFGTSGWRDVMADRFTFANLRLCTQAIAEEIYRQRNHNKPVVVGYDTRFLSEHFAKEAAQVLANNSMEVHLSVRDTPTPVVAFEIIRSQAAGGINITASHNPYDYNGLKFSSAWGGPALPEMTKAVEGIISMIHEGDVATRTKPEDANTVEKLILRSDFRPPYLKQIKSLIDTGAFRGRRLRVVVDCLWGTSHGYLDELLRDLGCEVVVLHENRDVYFGPSGAPDPSPEGLAELVETVKKTKADLGLACDGDSDRFSIVDAGGLYLTPNDVLPLLARYLHLSRGWEGIIARSVMTTHALDGVARRYGLELKETPVGFKYIGEIMKEAESIWPSTGGEFIMGAEESGGFTMRGHVPEKDGILACLLTAEMAASTKKSVAELIQDLFREVGPHVTRRLNIKATADIVAFLKEKLSHKPPTEINGLHVHRIVDIDGFKFIFSDGSWIGVRFSGTEPVVRLYLEGKSEEQLDLLSKAGQSLLHNKK
ncbi:MAG: phosphoglucomutase/phosphomannomutase family protein [Elusimicrobia bacterium]|nr:phosphoglucomutase/phosphomannomutase family protein [Candidatus Obscuribacterium magneticum]